MNNIKQKAIEVSCMNGLLWILLLCCCGQNNHGGNANYCNSKVEKRECCESKEKACCSLNEREQMWTPYMGNNLNTDSDCGCEHSH